MQMTAKFMAALGISIIIGGCSENQFASTPPTNKKAPPTAEGQTTPQNSESTNTPEKSDDLIQNSGQSITKYDEANCWFAVSGAWIGISGTFPTTDKFGDNIKAGGVFDEAGGTFLIAREEPYIDGADSNKGGITNAVASTFDTIMIASGMTAEIRDAQNNLILQQNGPYIARLGKNDTKDVIYLA